MSQTFSITCAETKEKVWVGQGWGGMTCFYGGEPETMKRLGAFLREHEGKPLVLLCDDTHRMLCDYHEYGEDDESNMDICNKDEHGNGTSAAKNVDKLEV